MRTLKFDARPGDTLVFPEEVIVHGGQAFKADDETAMRLLDDPAIPCSEVDESEIPGEYNETKE